MRRLIIRALILVVGAASVGFAVNAVRTDVDRAGTSRRLPLIAQPKEPLGADEEISLAEAETLWNGGTAFFLDARAPADYAAGHIALAHNLPSEAFQERYPTLAGMLTKEAAIVVYCDGEACELSHEVAGRLRQLGYANVRVLVNGWTVWRKQGLATQVGEQP